MDTRMVTEPESESESELLENVSHVEEIDVPSNYDEIDEMDDPANYLEFENDNDDEDTQLDGDREEENTDPNKPTADSTDHKENVVRIVNLPLSRVRHIMKLDPECSIIPSESVFLVTKATELFIQSLAKESYVQTAAADRKTISMRDVEVAIDSVDALMFLEGVFAAS